MNRQMAHPQNGPRRTETVLERRSSRRWIPRWVVNLFDRWRHPGESGPMRDYRRWREATGREDYVLSTVRPVSGPSRILTVPWTDATNGASPAAGWIERVDGE